ncbi:MAG: right-handed parallel beta-helix repeat-containing protein [Candidatus Methanoperedens sp.]|nr:right-handed parallel beta-helix repeat-containing protein [Candidatus Methanoperedens sp.]
MVLNSIHGGRALGIAVGITALVLLLPGGAGAATLTVNASGGANYTSIQKAINAASAGDTILVYSGTYYETVTVNKQLELKGQDSGGGLPVINTAGLGDAITVTANGVIIDGFNAKTGSHLYNGIKLISNNNIIKSNIASNNLIGFWLYSSSNNTLSNNTASNNSYGIYLDFSSSNMLSNNTASSNSYYIYLSYGIYLNSSSNNTLIGNNVSNNPFGIGLYNSNNNMLNGNIASNNLHQFHPDDGTGITLSSSSNNTLIGNNASNNGNQGGNIDNDGTGIILSSSSNNTLIGNNASNNGNYGIKLDSSSNSSLSGNNMKGNPLNFNIDGSTDSHFIQSIDTSNTVNGKPVYYIIGASGVTYDLSTNAGWFGCINCNDITLKDSTFMNNYPGVLFWNTSNSNIQNVTLNNNRDGLLLGYSENNNVINNTASSNYYGIHLKYSSNNTLTNNTASPNSYGIYLSTSSNNTLTNNTASSNGDGISLSSSTNNRLSDNDASNNVNGIALYDSINNTLNGNIANSNFLWRFFFYVGSGFWLLNSNSNTFIGNSASNNGHGILLDDSSNNNIIYNNFFNNTNNFGVGGGSNNWNTTKTPGINIIGGSYIGGNIWAYPNGTGFSQTCADSNSDGICDSTYTLDANNIDYLPLAYPSNITPKPLLVTSITPNCRNAQVGTPVTIFMSVINGGSATATNVSITQASSLPVKTQVRQWNGTAFIEALNAPVNISAGGTANFVVGINATSAFNSSSLTFNVSSTNEATAPISGVNTLTLSASTVPSADIIMMSTSLDVSTAVNTPTVFAVATTNVGGANATGVSLVLSVPTSISGLSYHVNETYPANGTIKGPAAGLTINVGATPTFAVFVTPMQPIANDPANNRITLQLKDGSGKIIGAQSVAVSTT